MKHLKQKLSAVALSLLISLAAALSAIPAYAAGPSITLVANKATVASGGSLIVAVYMNGGGNPINAVEADLSYPASKLQYIGVNYSGSAFEISASGGGGDGSVTLDRGTTGAVSGSGLVATLTFKALTSSGSGTIAVGGNSALVNNGNAVGFSPGSVNITFSDYVAPSAGPAAPTAVAVPEPPKDTTAPTIAAVRVKSMTPYSAVLSWATNEPADSVVDYGLDTNYGLSASQPGTAMTHEVTLSSSFLLPKTLLHYRVKSADAAGNVQTGTDQTLELPGVAVTIIVRGEDGQPQPNAVVTLDDQTVTTDTNGQAVVHSSLGSKQVVITYAGSTVRRPITVTKTTKPLPPIKLDLAKQPLNHWMLTSIGLAVVVLTLLALDGLLFGSTFIVKLMRWRAKDAAPKPATAGSPAPQDHQALFDSLLHHKPTEPKVQPVATPELAAPTVPSPAQPEVQTPVNKPAWHTITPPAEPVTGPTAPTADAPDIDQAKIDAIAITPLTPAPLPVAPVASRAARSIPVMSDEPSEAARVAKRLKPRAPGKLKATKAKSIKAKQPAA